jgi:glycosyltransferase involved in cell wall biosynthesis
MSDTNPVVTIGIPSYNCAAFIGEAISSVLSQDYRDLEVLVVDDASTDGTLDVLAGFDDPRVRVLVNEVNLGPGRNWNKVLDEARGRYVKVMGCDDALTPGSVSAQVAVLEENPSVVLVTGPRILITESGRRLMRRGTGGIRGLATGAVAGRAMIRRGSNLVGEPVAHLLRKSALDRVGGYHEGNPYCIDMDMALRLLEVGDLYVLDKPMAFYRIVGASWSAAVAQTQDSDVIALLHEMTARGAFGTSLVDAVDGAHYARRLAVGRRLIYKALFDEEFHRQIRYLFVGGWNTLFGYLSFVFFYWLLAENMGQSSATALVVSYIPAILNAYFGYRIFVFRSRNKFIKEFPRFSIVYVVALAINILVFPWIMNTLRLNPYLSQALFTVALVIGTYIVNRTFSFRQDATA